jgi:hypothetical protein
LTGPGQLVPDLLISIAATPFCAPREKLNCAGLTYVTRTGKREIAERRAANKWALKEIHRIWLRDVCPMRRAHSAIGNPVRARVRKSARSRAHGYPLSLAMRVHLERGAVAAPSPRVNALVEQGRALDFDRRTDCIIWSLRAVCAGPAHPSDPPTQPLLSSYSSGIGGLRSKPEIFFGNSLEALFVRPICGFEGPARRGSSRATFKFN